MSEIRKSSVDEYEVVGARVMTTEAEPRLRVEGLVKDDVSVYRAYSFTEYDREGIADIYTQAVDLPYATAASIEHGLRKITYPDSSIALHIRRQIPEVYPGLRHDSRQLVHVMQRSDGLEYIPANVAVYSYSQAFFASQEMMRLMKRTNFIAFVNRCGYEINEIAARRTIAQLRYDAAGFGQRSGKYVKPHVIAAYLEYLRQQEGPYVIDTLERAFFDMMFAALELEARTDAESSRDEDDNDDPEDVVYVNSESIPPYLDTKHTQVSLSRVPDSEPQKIEFVRSVTPYIARPMLSWRTDTAGNRQLVTERTRPSYDIVDKVLYHRSAQLGMLSINTAFADISPSELARRTARLTARGPEYRKWTPAYTIGVAGVVLSEAYGTDGPLTAELSERLALYEQAMQ